MSIYSDKLVLVQVVITCWYSVSQMRTREDALVHNLGAPCIDNVMSYNSVAQMCTREDALTPNLDAPCIDEVMSYDSLTTIYLFPYTKLS